MNTHFNKLCLCNVPFSCSDKNTLNHFMVGGILGHSENQEKKPNHFQVLSSADVFTFDSIVFNY